MQASIPGGRPRADRGSGLMSAYNTILVAFDGSDASAVALRQGAELAQACKAQLHVIAVVVTSAGLMIEPAAMPGDVLIAERKSLANSMAIAVGHLGEMGSTALTCVCDGEASAEIIAYAHEIKADLVVLGHAEKSFFASLFAGATGKHLLGHLPCSTLIAVDGAIKPDDSERSKTAVVPDALPCACSTVVLQLPRGEQPTNIEHFDRAAQLHLPERIQHETGQPSWLSLAQLISQVHTIKMEPGKQRWIKAGNIVLSPTDIQELHNFYRHHGTRK